MLFRSVSDYKDDCPTVKGVKENRGCPAVKKEVLKVFKQALHGIQFDSGKATIKPVSFGILNMVVDIMRNNPEYNLIIAGHTDSQGNDDFNMTLSDKRAAAVRQYLIDKGVSSDRLQSKGYGETKPVATNKTVAELHHPGFRSGHAQPAHLPARHLHPGHGGFAGPCSLKMAIG